MSSYCVYFSIPFANIPPSWYTGAPMSQPDTVLFLHGPLMRTPRLLLEGLSAFAATRGWRVQRASPPRGAGTAYLRRLAEFWHPVGFVGDYGGASRGMPLPDGSLALPFVCIDLDETLRARRVATSTGAPPLVGFVNAADDAFARLAARELIRYDFMAYAVVSAYSRQYWSRRRVRVFRDEVEGAGGTVRTFGFTDISGGTGIRRLGEWLRGLPKPCGLLAVNDRTAALVLTAAARYEVTVPDEVAVIGIDDDELLCENMAPPLTSIRADFVGGGRLAGSLLSDLVDGKAQSGASLLYGEQRIVRRLSTRRLNRPAPSIRAVLETIRRRSGDGISAADILPMLGGSQRSAEKRFRAATGKSILEEILDVRFDKLLPLLEQEHLQLGSLATLAGFSSENHLQRQFKARYGMTLSAWRKQGDGGRSRPNRCATAGPSGDLRHVGDSVS